MLFTFAPWKGNTLISVGEAATQVLVYFFLCQIDPETRTCLSSRDVSVVMDAIIGRHIKFLEPTRTHSPLRKGMW